MGAESDSENLHRFDDCDVKAGSHHHTLGRAPQQAAPGNIGEILLSDITFTGAVGTYNPTTMQQILDALVALGATDNTT